MATFLLFLPGISHRQESMVGYSPRDRRRVEQDLATKTTLSNHEFTMKTFSSKATTQTGVTILFIISVTHHSQQVYLFDQLLGLHSVLIMREPFPSSLKMPCLPYSSFNSKLSKDICATTIYRMSSHLYCQPNDFWTE